VRTTIDYRELTAERQRSIKTKPELRGRSWNIVKSGAFNLEKGVKFRMPVDTGHARANWGHGEAGIWIENEADLELIEGTKVVYVPRLNEGWSRQAPAGFIDAEALKVEAEVNVAISRMLDEVL
jgi:hypothetical protein